MPTCCIKNCKSRTYRTETKGITFYRFPREESIRQVWINVCQRSEENIKIDSARICSLHFDDNCFVMEWTGPQSKELKQLQRLRGDAIPTKMLLLEETKKRKIAKSNKTITNKNVKIQENNSTPSGSALEYFEGEETIEIIEKEREEKGEEDSSINEIVEEVSEKNKKEEKEEKGKKKK